MPKVEFYRQARVDRGVRTGVIVDDTRALEYFEGGQTDRDPALLWFVDVRCEGDSIPGSADEARDWLMGQAQPVRRALSSLAERLKVGLDLDSWPIEEPIAHLPEGTQGKVVCSAVGRTEDLRIASILGDIAERWESLLESVEHPQPA